MITCDKCGFGHLTIEEKLSCKSWAEMNAQPTEPPASELPAVCPTCHGDPNLHDMTCGMSADEIAALEAGSAAPTLEPTGADEIEKVIQNATLEIAENLQDKWFEDEDGHGIAQILREHFALAAQPEPTGVDDLVEVCAKVAEPWSIMAGIQIRALRSKVNGSFKVVYRPATPASIAQAKKFDEARKREQSHALARSEPLDCDRCGARMGFIAENDCNGTYFFCNRCKVENL